MGASTGRRGVLVITLSVCFLLLFLALAALNAFNLNFLNPASPQQTLVFIGLSLVAFLLFVGVLVLLVRNVLKLYADQRNRILGTRLRTRMLWGAVLVSLVPLVFMFAFSYLLLNRAVYSWFSQPVTQMRDGANRMTTELFAYAAANARSEADTMAIQLADTPLEAAKKPSAAGSRPNAAGQKPNATAPRPNAAGQKPSATAPRPSAAAPRPNAAALRPNAAIARVLEAHQLTLQGGFVLLYRDGRAIASLHVPTDPSGTAELTALQPPDTSDDESPHDTPPVIATTLHGPTEQAILQAAQRNDNPFYTLAGNDYTLATAGLKHGGLVVVGLPIPAGITSTAIDLRKSTDAYWTLFRERRQIRWLYTLYLLLTTGLALFAICWLALNLAKQVTRPIESLADAMEAIAAGDYAHRVPESATEELGELAASFNAMAYDLESAHDIAARSTHQLSDLNAVLQARRTELETIIETIPNGVVTLSADRHIVLANRAFSELLDPGGQKHFVGLALDAVLPAEIVDALDRLLRRAHRMGSASAEMQMTAASPGRTSAGLLHLSATVALLESSATPIHTQKAREAQKAREHLGYVLVLEDATELLRAQKQSAWKEVARRVAHEIKNPLTPISLNAELIGRHIARLSTLLAERSIETPSVAVIQRCSQVISSSVETMRSLVDQFSTLAEFPSARPRPADLNTIVEDSLSLFAGRLGNIQVRRKLAPNLPLVLADPESLKRALTNLIDNAAEAMQDSLLRELHLSTRLLTAAPNSAGPHSQTMVELCVADTGPGLTDDMRERLFLPYFSTKQRGTGLGLAIAAKILQEHHGTIRAEKNLPAGARFILELRPASYPDPEAAEPATITGRSEVTVTEGVSA